MTFGSPTTPLEAAVADAVAERLGHTPPPMWSLEEPKIGIHPDDPEWGYAIVRIPITTAELIERLRASSAGQSTT